MTPTYRGIVLALAATFSLSACRKNPETVATPVNNPTTTAPTETCDQRCRDSIANAATRAREDSINRANAARAAAIEAATNTLKATIFFDYDQSDIRGDARQTLDAKLPILRSSATVQLRIAGHADERGSDQYNDALGQARAASARRYLTDNGIDGSRISIVSYGESRPLAMGADESAWARNRRAEFEITAGTVVPPR
jgi:peptidoglycan-associated lipoprotein